MRQIIEIIPNYSEGKDLAVLEKITAPFQHPDITLCKLEMDPSYHRTVVTVIGELHAVLDAAVESIKIARDLIDLNHHVGQHKRMGACDVLPLLPIANIAKEELLAVAEAFAQRVNEECDVPVYLYNLSAKREQCTNLPDIRKGEFEGLKEKIKEEKWHPDFGTPQIHPTFGAMAIGVRIPLVAFNIDLDTADEAIVKSIAKYVRFSSGGYRYIQAGPAFIAEKGIYQVTMNITDGTKMAMYRILETIRMEAKRFGVSVTGSEIIGLVSKQVLVDSILYYEGKPEGSACSYTVEEAVNLAKKYMQLYDFTEEKVIEHYV